MANKNTKSRRAIIRDARRNGNAVVTINVPAQGYHNDAKPQFSAQTVPVLASGADSRSPARNMVQRILKNTGPDGQKMSVTVHGPDNKASAFRPFIMAKRRLDDKGKTMGIGAAHSWIYPEERGANYARPSIG